MLDPISLATALSSLIVGSTKLVQLANDVRQRYASSELLMCSIAAECSAVTVALAHLDSALRGRGGSRPGHEDGDLLKSVEAVSMACGMTMGLLEKYMVGIMEDGDGDEVVRAGEISKGTALGRKGKMSILWNEDDIRRLVQQMRGHQASLSLLLNVIQCQSDAEIRMLLMQNQAALKMVLNVLSGLDMSSISLSGITLQIEQTLASNDVSRLLTIKDEEELSGPIVAAEEKELFPPYEQLDSSGVSRGGSSQVSAMPVQKSQRVSLTLGIEYFQTVKKSRFFSSTKVPRLFRCALVGDWASNYGHIFKAIDPSAGENLYTSMEREVTITTRHKGKTIEAVLCFFTDIDDYEGLYPYWYGTIDLFLFCIATEYADTVDTIRDRWVPALAPHRKATAKSIVLCTNDHCRADPAIFKTLPNKWISEEEKLLSQGDGERLAAELGAVGYIVCKGTSSESDMTEMVHEAITTYLSTL